MDCTESNKRKDRSGAALLLLVGAGVAYATGDDSSSQATGSNIDKAKTAGLDHTNFCD
jgi:hypothetical protein